MQVEKEVLQIFDSLRKIAFYVGHGKYNDYMSIEEVSKIKETIEKIIDIEKEYEETKTLEEKQNILKRIKLYENYSIRDFLNLNIKKV